MGSFIIAGIWKTCKEFHVGIILINPANQPAIFRVSPIRKGRKNYKKVRALL
jgi:hypothetical protein